MLNALVRRRLLYSCQTWSCTKAQMNNVNATYLSFLRKMVKGGYRRKDNSWAYVFTNNDLLRMAGAEDIHAFVCKQQVKFVTKVIRKENESIQKRLLFNDNEATKRGPKTNLMSSILNSTGQTTESLCATARQLIENIIVKLNCGAYHFGGEQLKCTSVVVPS